MYHCSAAAGGDAAACVATVRLTRNWPSFERAAGHMTVTVVAIFAIVYLGMILGGLPFVQLDRTGSRCSARSPSSPSAS